MAKSNSDDQLDPATRVSYEGSTGTGHETEPRVTVSLKQPEVIITDDQGLWTAIRNRTKAIGFDRYQKIVDGILCKEGESLYDGIEKKIRTEAKQRDINACPSIHGTHAYNILKLATEVLLMLESGVVGVVVEQGAKRNTLLDPKLFNPQEEGIRHGHHVSLSDIETQLTNYFGGTKELPYLRGILKAILGSDEKEWKERLPYCEGVLMYRFTCPSMIELIWSYWHEEGMLAQTLSAITLRFQNRRGGQRDPLAQLEIDPLRPLNNLLWGYIQDELHRLTVVRRAYEYDHHYGMTLHGKAVPTLRSADSRSKFLEAFHNLLHRCSIFYREDADTTVISDGFPLLNALKEVHLVLAEGAGNQFGDLPWTARVEMLIQQWLLSRPEMKEFLRGRAMVPYQETWMGQVDAMKKLQGWTDATVTHFHNLAVYGEQILLSIRYGDWSNVVYQDQAKNWVRYWKPEIQGYIHAYRVVTGVDLTTEPVDTTPPYIHLRRLEEEKMRAVQA